MSATDELRALLDAHGVEHRDRYIHTKGRENPGTNFTTWFVNRDNARLTARANERDNGEFGLFFRVSGFSVTPAQAIEATLGREPWVSPTWERWHKSLRHDEIKSIGDAVEQLMYEVIEFGGDMGPNGNTYNGIDEGDVLTAGFINEWVERFEATLGRGTCRIEAHFGEWYCTGCGEMVGTCDPTSELCIDGNAIELWSYCPNCGRRVEQ